LDQVERQAPPTQTASVGQRERTKMSEDDRNYVNLRDFVAIPPGSSPDPAKVVSTQRPACAQGSKSTLEGIHKEAQKLHRTMDLHAG